jgi:hypothetical protein
MSLIWIKAFSEHQNEDLEAERQASVRAISLTAKLHYNLKNVKLQVRASSTSVVA